MEPSASSRCWKVQYFSIYLTTELERTASPYQTHKGVVAQQIFSRILFTQSDISLKPVIMIPPWDEGELIIFDFGTRSTVIMTARHAHDPFNDLEGQRALRRKNKMRSKA